MVAILGSSGRQHDRVGSRAGTRARPHALQAAYGSTGTHAGAGKTTLLDILACREKRGTVGGDVILGQQPFNKRRFKQLGGCATTAQ